MAERRVCDYKEEMKGKKYSSFLEFKVKMHKLFLK